MLKSILIVLFIALALLVERDLFAPSVEQPRSVAIADILSDPAACDGKAVAFRGTVLGRASVFGTGAYRVDAPNGASILVLGFATAPRDRCRDPGRRRLPHGRRHRRLPGPRGDRALSGETAGRRVLSLPSDVAALRRRGKTFGLLHETGASRHYPPLFRRGGGSPRALQRGRSAANWRPGRRRRGAGNACPAPARRAWRAGLVWSLEKAIAQRNTMLGLRQEVCQNAQHDDIKTF
jgi:hypothetical protein